MAEIKDPKDVNETDTGGTDTPTESEPSPEAKEMDSQELGGGDAPSGETESTAPENASEGGNPAENPDETQKSLDGNELEDGNKTDPDINKTDKDNPKTVEADEDKDNPDCKDLEDNPDDKSKTDDIENKDDGDEGSESPENEKDKLDGNDLDDPKKEPQNDDVESKKDSDETNNPDDEKNVTNEYDDFDEDELPDEEIIHEDNDPNRYDEYTEEDFKQLEDEDPGYINDKVLDYDHPDYNNEGIHRVDWGEDSADTPHSETLQPGTVLSRVGSDEGRYLGDFDVDFSDRQLPTYEGKQPLKYYEVQKPLPVEQSTIAQQKWAPDMIDKSAQQYVTDKPISQLIDEGYLKELLNK